LQITECRKPYQNSACWVRSNLNNPEHASPLISGIISPKSCRRLPGSSGQKVNISQQVTARNLCAKTTARTFPLIEFAAVSLAKRGSYRRAKKPTHWRA